MNWHAVLAYVKARLTERSTWFGIFTLLSAAGVMIAPDLRDAIIAVAVILAGGTAIVTPDPSADLRAGPPATPPTDATET